MRIEDVYNTTAEAIENRAWNLYLGVSVKNRYFTQETIRQFARWGAERTSERFAFLIVDILQRINNEVLEKISSLRALDKAFRQSDTIREFCSNAVAELPPELRDKVVLIEWADIVDAEYARKTKLVFDYFQSCEAFHEYIFSTVRDNLGGIVARLNHEDILRLCDYVLYEMAEFLYGFNYEGVHFNCCVYPGAITGLTRDLIAADFFQPLLAQLSPRSVITHASVYVEE